MVQEIWLSRRTGYLWERTKHLKRPLGSKPRNIWLRGCSGLDFDVGDCFTSSERAKGRSKLASPQELRQTGEKEGKT